MSWKSRWQFPETHRPVRSVVRSQGAGYCTAVLVPIAATFAVAWAGAPAFFFEHLIVLFAVGVAVIWGMGPAITAALFATFSDNLLLDEPIGRPAITGARDLIDLALFVTVAVTVAWLVARERQAREEQERLVMTVAHDLANPLGVIQGTIQFASAVGSCPDIDMRRLLSRVETAAARAGSLVKTLADVRALESGDLVLALEIKDFREVAAPVVHMFDGMSARHPVRFELPTQPVMVRCDPERLKRVIENLVSNAIKYSPEGGTIDVSLTTEGDKVVLSIRDHGIGISADALPHVFERGYRAPEAMAAAPGLGLGLNISAEIVKRHGGLMEVFQANSQGSIVSVRLPLLNRTAG
jgi:signal transduction histidine kinase